MNDTSASKSKSLMMTLLMVIMALSPIASVQANHDENGGYDLYIDGAGLSFQYEEVEVPWPSEVEIISCTMNSWGFDGWYECEIDVDGDGNNGYPDYFQHMADCVDPSNSSSGSWDCVVDFHPPLMDEGNYSLHYEVYGLEAGANYTAYIDTKIHDFNDALWYNESTHVSLDADSDGELTLNMTELYWDVSNSTCSGYTDFRIVGTNNSTEAFRGTDKFSGHCEGEMTVTTELDGVVHENTLLYQDGVQDCENYAGYWYCSLSHDSGEVDRYMVFFDMGACEPDDVDLDMWWCVRSYNSPLVWPGDHTVEWSANDLPDSSWMMQYDVSYDYDEWEGESAYFNGTSGSVETDVWTDEFTCNLQAQYILTEGEWDANGTWIEFGIFESAEIKWDGPCDEPPSLLTFTVDGVEHAQEPIIEEYDYCEADGFDWQCWNDDWDWDGDGEPDHTSWGEDCHDMMDESGMEEIWICYHNWGPNPPVYPGNHSADLLIDDLEAGWSYLISVVRNSYEGGGSSSEEFDLYFNATTASGDLVNHTESWDFETSEATCSDNWGIMVTSGNWGSSEFSQNDTHENNWFNYQGPCDSSQIFTLTIDGDEFDPDYEMQGYDNCEEDVFDWRCWNDDWDWDGDGEPDHTDMLNECYEDASNGTWWCTMDWYEPVGIEEGNHTMALSVDVENGSMYELGVQVEYCTWDYCNWDWMNEEYSFNATSDTHSETFHMETDNYTCNVHISVHLSMMMNDSNGNIWNSNHVNQYFRLSGPCEEPESPFTLFVDGTEYVEDVFYQNYDVCEAEEDHWRCWNDAWDMDGDGEPDWADHMEDCFEDVDNSTWSCVADTMPLSIEEGNHTMELEIDGLTAGENYSVEVDGWINGHNNWEEYYFDESFTAVSDEHTVSFHIETDNYTCGLGLDAGLLRVSDDGDQWHMAHDHWEFNGPCEEPPTPFTLYYDQMEWEEQSEDFDTCEDSWFGLECWNDEWDYDGDGEPEQTHGFPSEICEENADGTWSCYTGMGPDLEAGNHTMELELEDIEGWYGPGDYQLEIMTHVSDSQGGYANEMLVVNFTASSANYTETFHMETSDYTCGAHVEAYLYNVSSDGATSERIISDHWGFKAPCETPPSRINLTYEQNGSMIDWEPGESWEDYDGCTGNEADGWECWNDDEEWHDWYDSEDCMQDAAGDWSCMEDVNPHVDEGMLAMTFEISDLDDTINYALRWHVSESSFMDYNQYEFEEEFGTSAVEHSVDFEHWVDNTTCELSINADLLEGHDDDDDGNIDWWSHIDSNWWGFSGPCDIDLPVEITLEVLVNNTSEDVTGMDLSLLFNEDEDWEPTADELVDMMGYIFDSEGSYEFNLTGDGLEIGKNYTYEVENQMSEDELAFICGNGDEIPFDYVNDGDWDCEDGADEQQYDENGDPINWFDCSDGSTVWISSVNDGIDDCPNGEDEGFDESESGFELEFNATSDMMHHHFDMEVSNDTCMMMFSILLFENSEEEMGGRTVGMFMAIIGGPMMGMDDDGDGVPDCVAYMMEDNDGPDGPDGPDWNLEEDFAIGRDYSASLAQVDATNGTAMLVVVQHTTLDDDVRMKIDHDFFNGDDVLNETEAMEFEMMWLLGNGATEDCVDPLAVPPFTLNGIDSWCAMSYGAFENLANNSNGDFPVWHSGWMLHHNVSADENGEMTLYYPGGDTIFDFNGTLCGYSDGSGLVPVSWSYGNTTVSSDCVQVMAGEEISSIEILFGPADTDGDGYNDFEDRFPGDATEWNDTDDDGVGDNGDAFPLDASESSDFDGDGVGDNADAFPEDASESTDSDGDGVGDNGDDFPEDADEYTDSDGDGVGDNGDAFPWDPIETSDSDGDGWGDNSDAFPEDGTEWVDTDGDGVGDNADTDADGDGTSDSDEDSDGDGVNDDQDDFPFDANETTDSDGDGVGDNGDAFPEDENETTDTDGDGLGDNNDSDADGDGTPNDLDDFPLNSGESTDSDGDGVGDSEDEFPNNPNEYIDTDGDGVGNNADTDDDDDGTPDTSDAFPLDPNESVDTDGDGYGDGTDSFPNDAGEWSDYDGDGVGDNSDEFMSDPYESRDSDGDGTGDNADWAPNDPNEKVDSDGDGVGNNADAFPNNADETTDTDGDGIGDNADDDADGDGIPDEPIEPAVEDDGGGILPGFTAVTGLASVLGAAILVAGRRKD